MRQLYPTSLLLFVLLFFLSPALAQEETTLTLTMRRDFGFGMGSSIQGTFSLHASGPDDLQRVLFYMDEQILAEVTAPPFRHQFNTDNYPPGVHTYRAVGFTAAGEELLSNGITRNVVTARESSQTMIWVIAPILLLSLGVPALFALLSIRKKRPNGDIPIDGAFGGAICPKCKRPFARHWWGLNLIVGKYDRCPHCGRWSLVQAAHPDLLKASYEAMKQAESQSTPPPPTDPADDLRRRLDDSRFN
jgi:DNA-directed RNA polymerase subunit RPC12/RpoP